MQFNREEYVFLSRRGSVPNVIRAGPGPRPELSAQRRDGRSRAPRVRRWARALRVAIREFRLALDEGGEQYQRDEPAAAARREEASRGLLAPRAARARSPHAPEARTRPRSARRGFRMRREPPHWLH